MQGEATKHSPHDEAEIASPGKERRVRNDAIPPDIGAPGGIRTHNRLIRSQALCPLSYGGDFVHLTRQIYELDALFLPETNRGGRRIRCSPSGHSLE